MKGVMNHKVFKTVTAWLIAISMLLTTASSALPALAGNAGGVTDNNTLSVSELLNGSESLTWVFAGDSITHNATFTAGMNGYGEWFEQYLNKTGRDKDSVIISAWGGADVFDFQTKGNTPSGSGTYDYPGMGIENMITKYNPDVVFIKLGMNDRYKTTAQYTDYYNQMIDSITSICQSSYGKIPKIILLTPTPTAGESIYDDMREESKVDANWDSTLRHCEAVQKIAQERNLICVNLREAFMNAQLELGDDYFSTFFRDPSDGGIHPNAAGQYIMFKKLAETLGIDTTTDPIFQYEYGDFLAGELYTDLTGEVTYVNAYDTVTVANTGEQPKLLASIDFTSENGAFKKFTTTELSAYTGDAKKNYIYNNATHIDLTDASKCDDPLTLEEAQSLTNEYSIVFRAKLDASVSNSQPLLMIGQTEENWNNALVVGVPGYKGTDSSGKGKGMLYAGLKQSGTNILAGKNLNVTADATMDGSWHDFAVVQQKDKLIYYMDGVVFATSTAHMPDNFDIGSLVSEGKFVAQIGSYTKTSKSYNLAADMDFYQLYKGALSADQVKELADKSGTFAGTTTVVTTDADEMNKSMPSTLTTGTQTIASVDFDSTNGSFNGATSYAKATKWDLTAATNADPLTLQEVKDLKKEFTVVFRAKLSANQKPRDTNAVLYISNDDNDWDSSVVLHVPSTDENLYYKVIDSGKSGKNTAHTNGKWTFPMSSTQKSTDAWHTIAVVAGTDNVKYYIDGQLTSTIATVSSIDIGSLFSSLDETKGFKAHIGAVCNKQQGTYSLKASMDWYQLYGKALTAAEVAELSATTTPVQNQMDAVMPKLDLTTSGSKTYTSAYTWSQVAPEKGADVWVAAGGAQLMGNDGAVVNRSIYRLIDNAIRRTPTHRGTRLVDVASKGHSSEDLLGEQEDAIETYKPLAYLYVPDLSEVYDKDYTYSDEQVEIFKENVQAWLDKNKENNVMSILWTPLASPDTTINAYISAYADAIRSLMTDTNNKMLFFDANRFMNENLAGNSALSRNWFADEMQLTSLGARDVAYAFCMMSGMTRIADTNKEDEISQHDLRVTSDTCLFKGEYTRDLIQSTTSVSGTSVTVDVSAIKAVYPNMTNFTFKVLPFAHASSYNQDLYEAQATASGNSYTFTAPCTNPNIAVFGEMNGTTYRFADCTATVTATDVRYVTQNPSGVYLDSLEVVGAPALSFDKDTKTYNVTLYSYQRFIQILATAQDGLTITVDGKTVESGANSDLITVDSTKKVDVTVSDAEGTTVTYTLNLTRPDYPDIIITEVMTDAEYKTGNGGDDYEMVEIYNTTDHELNLKDYSIGHTKDYRYTKLKSLTDYPTFYFTGDNQIFSASADRSRSYTGINQITKYSTYWSGGEAEPDYIAFPAHSTMVIWIKYLDTSMTYDTLINDLKAAGEKYTLHVDGKPVVPDKEQLVVAEVPASLSSTIKANDGEKNAVKKHAAKATSDSVYENFYLAGWTGETEQSSNWYVRGWLYILKAGAQRDDNGSITEAGNDVVSASKFIKLTTTNKLSSIFSYNVERGMSLIENQDLWDEATWDDSYKTGHTSETQGYSNKTSFGAIEYWQKPYELADETKAVVDNKTPSSVRTGKSAEISLGLTDNTDVRYLELYVKKAGDTDWTVIKEDFVLKAGIANKGVSEDIRSKDYTYDLGVLTGDVSYYGYVLDGNLNKTTFGSEVSPCTITTNEGARVNIEMSIKDADGNAAAETITADVTLTFEAGTATETIENAYDVMNESGKVGTVNMLQGKLTGTFSLKNGEKLYVQGLPEGMTYTAKVDVPQGYKVADATVAEKSGTVKLEQAQTVKFELEEKAKVLGSMNVQMSIADEEGNSQDTVSTQVTITVEGGADIEFASSYDVKNGDQKIGTLTLSDGKLTGVFTMKNADNLTILDLPEGATYKVQMSVPDKYEAVNGVSQVTGTILSTAASNINLGLKEIPKPVGSVNITMSINDLQGQPADTAKADVKITVEQGNAQDEFENAYDILNGSNKVGALTLKDGKLSGTVSMKNGEVFTVAGLPEGASYTVKMTVPKGYVLAEGAADQATGTIYSSEIGSVVLRLCEKEASYGNLQIKLSIKDQKGNAAADTVKAPITILIEKGEATAEFTSSYTLYRGDKKVAVLTLRDGALSTSYLAQNGEVLEVKGLPEGAKYTVKLNVSEGYSIAEGTKAEVSGAISTATATVTLACKENAATGGNGSTSGGNTGDTGSTGGLTGTLVDGNTTGGSTNSSTTKTDTTKTGDQNNLVYWIALMLLAGIAGAGVCISKKNKNQEA